MQFNRFRLSELSTGRMVEAVRRRAAELPHTLTWLARSGLAWENRCQLSNFHDIHRGERCFIIGNGPSLKKMDLSVLRDEYSYGLNRIYLLFDQIGFLPPYYVCINELVLEQFSNEIQGYNKPKFLNWNRRTLFKNTDTDTHFVKIKLALRDVFGMDIRKPISSGGTVTFAAMQIAYFMGFQTVILIGVDHSYRSRGIPNLTVTRNEDRDLDHFHPEYFPKGSKWQPPDLIRSEVAYRLARRAFEADGRVILDATVNGNCTIFDKVAFTDLF